MVDVVCEKKEGGKLAAKADTQTHKQVINLINVREIIFDVGQHCVTTVVQFERATQLFFECR